MRVWKMLLTTFCALAPFFIAPVAGAITVTPPGSEPTKTDSPVIVTGYALTTTKLSYVQLHNSSDEVVSLNGWRLEYGVQGSSEARAVAALNGLLKPKGYIVVANTTTLPDADFNFTVEHETATIANLRLVPPNSYLDHTVSVKGEVNYSYFRRNVSTSTGNYLATFSAFQPGSDFSLYGRGLYEYPQSTGLQITEILANPRNCSPTDTSADCRDYIKLHNPTAAPIDLSQFRLRVGYQGQASSSSNTFSLAGLLPAGHYYAVFKSADDRSVAVTNNGGFVWLEDTFGIKRYDETVIEYADASAESKKGQAWAYDASDGVWKWTTQPTPGNLPSAFPPPPEPVVKVSSSNLTPCKEGQYRSEETNRCRNLATAAGGLAPCDAGEERNPETNRCRKVASLANQLTPCKEGQERNPETNRCRNVAATSPPPAAFGVEPVADTAKAFMGWWALGGLGIVALGYGAWEWRHELWNGVQKIGTFFTSGK